MWTGHKHERQQQSVMPQNHEQEEAALTHTELKQAETMGDVTHQVDNSGWSESQT